MLADSIKPATKAEIAKLSKADITRELETGEGAKMLVGNRGTSEILKLSHTKGEPIPTKYAKAVKGQASAMFGRNPAYEFLSIDSLIDMQKHLPKIVNDMTIEQAVKSYQIANELLIRKFDLKDSKDTELKTAYSKFEKLGVWDDGRPFPKVGDTVQRVGTNVIGLPDIIVGVVVKTAGLYKVRVPHQKPVNLTMSWDIQK